MLNNNYWRAYPITDNKVKTDSEAVFNSRKFCLGRVFPPLCVIAASLIGENTTLLIQCFHVEYSFLIEINKKGLGNNTNIFPNIVQEFPIPDISLKEQKKIVDAINIEIEKQKTIEMKILKKRNEIEQILSDTLKKTN